MISLITKRAGFIRVIPARILVAGPSPVMRKRVINTEKKAFLSNEGMNS